MNKYKYREPELDQFKSIWLTEKGHTLLRKAKLKEKKRSMAKILDDLIINNLKKYGQ